jgi:hypothetical protein
VDESPAFWTRLQAVCTAEACNYAPDHLVPDEWVTRVTFVPGGAARAVPLGPVQRAFLEAAPGAAAAEATPPGARTDGD